MRRFAAVFPIEFQGQRDGDGGGDDGQRRRKQQRRESCRPGRTSGVQTFEKTHGSKDKECDEDGDHPGLFGAEAQREGDVDAQQDRSHTQRRVDQSGGEAGCGFCPNRQAGNNPLTERYSGGTNQKGDPAKRIPAKHHSPVRIGEHPGKPVPVAPLVIGHGGIGDHGPVDHSQKIQYFAGDSAPDQNDDEIGPGLLPQNIPVFQQQCFHCFSPFTRARMMSSMVGFSSWKPTGARSRRTSARTPP